MLLLRVNNPNCYFISHQLYCPFLILSQRQRGHTSAATVPPAPSIYKSHLISSFVRAQDIPHTQLGTTTESGLPWVVARAKTVGTYHNDGAIDVPSPKLNMVTAPGDGEP